MLIGTANAVTGTAREEAAPKCKDAHHLLSDVINGIVDDGILAKDDDDTGDFHKVLQSIARSNATSKKWHMSSLTFRKPR